LFDIFSIVVFSMFEVVKWMSDSGLSTTDTIGLEASLMITGAVWIISIKLLANRSAQLTDLTCRLEELCLIFNIDERVINTIAKRNTKKSLILFIVGLVSFFFFFFFFFFGLWSQLADKLTIHSIPCSWIGLVSSYIFS
jgi:hypothetical protein